MVCIGLPPDGETLIEIRCNAVDDWILVPLPTLVLLPPKPKAKLLPVYTSLIVRQVL